MMASSAAAEAASVAPLFYYNQILATPGEEFGLNFFEPRYVLMCRRVAARRAPATFLFTPNYEDYTARAGDWAFQVA